MYKDLTNQRFGRLLVLSRAGSDRHGNSRWNVKCNCGKQKVVISHALLSGAIVSCGCYNREVRLAKQTKHKSSKTRLFRIWQYMKGRCYNKKNTAYSYYGGRGIIVCEEWKESFETFQEWAFTNGYNETLTLDRINPDKNYSPDNCRWVDRKTQMRNRRNTLNFTINGVTKDLATWCEEYNVPYERTRHRVVNRGWDIVSALTTPKLNKMGNPVKN